MTRTWELLSPPDSPLERVAIRLSATSEKDHPTAHEVSKQTMEQAIKPLERSQEARRKAVSPMEKPQMSKPPLQDWSDA